MRIGELAAKAGVSTRALRYYEQHGLISSRRTDNGYRQYDESDVPLVAQIRALLAAGFSLEDTRPFVDCLRAGHDSGDSCPESVAVYRRKLAEIDLEIRSLVERRAEVANQLARACPGCVLSPERMNDHVDDGELRRARPEWRQAGAGRLLGRLVPAVQDDRAGA
ncbi:MerR family transcriptional regulator [Sinosporangium siamense]|uniref:MerR family transcriptional regulator n=1 Tax=Sinosporangium siamense TaxID=1367973 RepID=A0A919VAB9_9ACTN|nr:MerR family transcriptional regulator [Sinosporangium siamense]GII95252.1 MerR family transcriptional regulator [Sinosporangium siamense]